MAIPARIPCPTLAYCKASKTSCPKPLAPIKDATTTLVIAYFSKKSATQWLNSSGISR